MASILVVDDEQGVRNAYEAVLRHEGYRVYAASTAGTALQLLDRTSPDLVLLDIKLSEWDPTGGIAVLQRMRERQPAIKVVIVSAYLDAVTRQIALEAGALACWTKPITLTTLVEQTREVFATSRV